MRFSKGVYDVLKAIAQIWLPSAGTLYFALAQIWHLPSAIEVVGTVTAVDTFLGVILGISTASYNNSDAKYDGALEITNTDDKKTFALNLNTHPDDLEKQHEVVLKVSPQ